MEMIKQMPRYMMDKFGLLRLCGKKGKTKITVDFNNDTGAGVMKIETEDTEPLLSKGIEELRKQYGDKLAP